jgi:ureidoglycolate hydrolase
VAEERRAITPEPLAEETWAPFGWLPVADTDPRDGNHRMVFEWADPHVNTIGHARAEVPQTDRGLRCEMLYRHATHTQAIMSLDVPAVIAVAASGLEFSDANDWAQIRVFRLEPLQPLVLHQGTWHWGPFPVEADEVHLFNVQGLRYAEDNECVDLDAKGLSVDVVLA